ncbi:MAG: hypothetical protein AAGC69_05560 [Paracraurococcus sp.]
MKAPLLLALLLPAMPAAMPALAHDYPTVARADYVLGCMAANGNTRLALERCACSIDAIAATLPYDTYEAAETALREQAGNLGERGAEFRDVPQVRATIEALRLAQAEATLQCFP